VITFRTDFDNPLPVVAREKLHVNRRAVSLSNDPLVP
jgi:hypothetical protein